MKKKSIIIITFFIVLTLVTGYRYFYGEWNPFVLPDRIECYSRRYYKSHNSPIEIIDKEKLYLINSMNILTGKRLYSMHPKGEYVPTVIYLETVNDKYQTYELSGGP